MILLWCNNTAVIYIAFNISQHQHTLPRFIFIHALVIDRCVLFKSSQHISEQIFPRPSDHSNVCFIYLFIFPGDSRRAVLPASVCNQTTD